MKKILIFLTLLTLLVVACTPGKTLSGQAINSKTQMQQPILEKKAGLNPDNKIPKIITCPDSVTPEKEYFTPNNYLNGKFIEGKSIQQNTDEFSPTYGTDEQGNNWIVSLNSIPFNSRQCGYLENGLIFCSYKFEETSLMVEGVTKTFNIHAVCPNAKPYTENSCKCY